MKMCQLNDLIFPPRTKTFRIHFLYEKLLSGNEKFPLVVDKREKMCSSHFLLTWTLKISWKFKGVEKIIQRALAHVPTFLHSLKHSLMCRCTHSKWLFFMKKKLYVELNSTVNSKKSLKLFNGIFSVWFCCV